MVLRHGPLDSTGTLPLLVLLVLLVLLGFCVQLHHVGRSPSTKVRMMLPGVVVIYVFITWGVKDNDHQGEAGAFSLNGFALNGYNFG